MGYFLRHTMHDIGFLTGLLPILFHSVLKLPAQYKYTVLSEVACGGLLFVSLFMLNWLLDCHGGVNFKLQVILFWLNETCYTYAERVCGINSLVCFPCSFIGIHININLATYIESYLPIFSELVDVNNCDFCNKMEGRFTHYPVLFHTRFHIVVFRWMGDLSQIWKWKALKYSSFSHHFLM